MTRSQRFALLTGVALPVLLAVPASGIAEGPSAATPIVVAQADAVAAAQAEVKAAKAALRDAQKNGGDVAAAEARLEAALNALAAAKAAQGQAAPPPQPPVQPQPEQQQEAAPPAPPAAEPFSQETPPQSATPPAQPPAAESPAPETPAQPPASEQVPSPEQAAPPEQAPSEPQTKETPAPETPPAVQEPPPEQPQSPAPSSGQAPPPPEHPVPPEQAQPKAPAGEQPAPTEQQAQPKAPAAEQPAQAEAQPQTQAPPEESAVESQLKAQGNKQELENVRTLRDKLRQEFARGEPDNGTREPRKGSGEVRQGSSGDNGRPGDYTGGDHNGRHAGDGDRRGHQRPPSDEGNVVLDFGLGFVVQLGDQLVIRRDSASESERFLDRARDVNVEHFRGGYTRTVVTRGDGTRIYTVRNQYGDIITRTRVTPNGNRVVLIDNRDFYRDGHRPRYGHDDHDLPPLRIDIPHDQYVVETSRSGRNDIRAALMAPPVEAVEHPYSLEEVRTSRRLRDKLRRVDLNTITFDFGSAAISPSQFDELAAVGTAIEDILARSPNEIFLVEGFTDAVGSPTNNLILSDQRAEAIAVALSSNFAIPPENLVTQGYGEQYLKVDTQEAERENRRVTVQRITPLVAQSTAAAQ